jgi:hypothetical protein
MGNTELPVRFILVGVDANGCKNARLEYEFNPKNRIMEEMPSFRMAFQRAFGSSRAILFEGVLVNEDSYLQI